MNKIKKILLSETTLYIFIFLGISYFFLVISAMALFTTLDVYEVISKEEKLSIKYIVQTFYPPMAILTSAIIAGLGIIQNINNTQEIEKNKMNTESLKSIEYLKYILFSIANEIYTIKSIFEDKLYIEIKTEKNELKKEKLKEVFFTKRVIGANKFLEQKKDVLESLMYKTMDKDIIFQLKNEDIKTLSELEKTVVMSVNLINNVLTTNPEPKFAKHNSKLYFSFLEILEKQYFFFLDFYTKLEESIKKYEIQNKK